MYRAMKLLPASLLAACVLLAGCASASHPETPCATLNREIGVNARNISAVAARRGTVDKLDIPFWVPGGNKAVAVVRDRQSARIEKLQAEQSAMVEDRDRGCR